jgi:hypothetical protein
MRGTVSNTAVSLVLLVAGLASVGAVTLSKRAKRKARLQIWNAVFAVQ